MSELYGTDEPTGQDVPEQQLQEAAGWETAEFGEPEEPAEVGGTDEVPLGSDAFDGAGDGPGQGEPDEPDRLAVAADRDVDLSDLGMDAVWRESNEPLYRSENREPEDIFENGFVPKDSSNTDLRHYVAEDDPSAFVSTSYHEDIGDEFGGKYTYELDVPGGIDVNKTLWDHPLAYEEEVAFPGGIRSEYIAGASSYDYGTGERGDFIPNPNYIPEADRVK
ncbi:hypothetical protein [Streptomyces sp. NPDC048481]|uniref:scabin-related ADP-ribosyltransferase n=1 Tax=Streptomyces sp. NPDC048481 TaxID=3365557 RepID=UPI0037227AF9